MPAHPLIEVHFIFVTYNTEITRHVYHVPREGDVVTLSEGDRQLHGEIVVVHWIDELVEVRVE